MFRIIAIAFTIIAFLGINGITYGDSMNHEGHDNKSINSQTSAEKPLNKAEIVGNKSCPVTGEKIDKKTEVTYEYKGKIYSFCCRSCIGDFKKNPEKYIEIIEKRER